MSDNDNEDGFDKGCALIMSNLGIAPTQGSYEDFASNYAKALWLETWREKRRVEMYTSMFGKVDS